jgi:hypothetical protein
MTKKATLKRKLELHRETVRMLNLLEEAMVAGGATVHSQCLTFCPLDSCGPHTCTC